MSELDFLNDVNTIISHHIKNSTIFIDRRDPKTASSMDVVISVYVQDNSINQSLIEELINYKINSNKNGVDFMTKRDIGKLDVEIISISAEIFYKG